MFNKNILVVLPYTKIFPPENGGQLRCFYLINELSKKFNVHVVLHQKIHEINSNEADLKFDNSIRFYSSFKIKKSTGFNNIFLLSKLFNAIKYRIYVRNIFAGSADSNLLEYYSIINKLLVAIDFDYVLLEHLVSLNAQSLIRRKSPKSKIILDAHNVDHELMELEFMINSNLKPNKKLVNRTKKIESSLYKKIDFLLACSEIDKTKFEKLNNNKLKVFNIPNGVDTIHKPFIKDIPFSVDLIFCGALNTEANYTGLYWFINEIWPLIISQNPNIHLNIIGSGMYSVDLKFLSSQKNINFIGRVKTVNEYYNKSRISIVPILIGSGSRLKILEAMSFGLPVVSTSKGAEGIACKHMNDIFIADSIEEFASSVIDLINDPNLYDFIRTNASLLVKKNYSWDAIGIKLRALL
jgi:glycosyltransferase involved in cell wall biosynthesis